MDSADYTIAIIGSPNAISGFKALGVSAFPVSNQSEGLLTLKQVVDGNIAILMITEDWAELLTDELDKIKQMTLPAVTVIPCQNGSRGLGELELRKIVERAVGSDILFKNN